MRVAYLERQRLPSTPHNSSLNIGRTQQPITIRYRRQRPRQRLITCTPKIIIRRNRIPGIRRIKRVGTTHKHIRLHKHLCAVAGIDAVVNLVKVAVVYVACAEADGRGARVDVVPVIVVLGYA